MLPGELTPLLQEHCTRLGQAADSFREAAAIVTSFTGVKVSESTVRRLTEGGGVALLAQETEAASAAAAPCGTAEEAPAQVYLSVDGAMVPVLHGEWREVKTLVIGVPEPASGLPRERAEQETVCKQLSYFSRMEEVGRFTELAKVEVRRRRVVEAEQAAAGSDGSEWCQRVFDTHRSDAVRILDFTHGAGYVKESAEVIFGKSFESGEQWVAKQLHRLKHEGGPPVVAALRAWEAALKDPAEQKAVAQSRNYLEKRETMLRYPEFRAAGWPIGTGSVESGNKLVVERRLKGPGMHWAEGNVNPMLALRNASCSRRWEAAWRQIVLGRRSAPQPAEATRAKA